MSMFSSGIVLAQHKEPALSRKMLRFVNPHVNQYKLNRAPLPASVLPDTDTLIQIAREADIIDESDGVFLHEKLTLCRGSTAAVVVDAIDDEPYVSSKLAPLLQMQEELLGGVELCKYLCDTKTAPFIVYKHLTDIESHIPARIGDYPVVKVRGGYPATPSFLQVRRLGSGRKLILSVGAAIRLYRAVRHNISQHTAFVTVAGNCVSHPVNMEVSLGITVAQVLERIGLSEQPDRIVCGGAMRGFAVTAPERTLIMPTTRAVLALRQSKGQYYAACTGCGRCEQICPMGLNPAYIHRFISNGCYNQLRRFDAHICIGCGTCSYICPSRLDVAGSVKKAHDFAYRNFLEKSGPA